MHPTIDEWIARDSVPFTDEGIDRMVATMPEVDLLGFGEARFTETVFPPTAATPAALVAGLTPQTGSTRNPTYFPWTGDCLTDFDWLAFVKSTTYQRGGPPLHAWDADQTPRDDTRK